jgi:hypothetical protein
MLKQDLSIDTTFNPPSFSSDSTFKVDKNQFQRVKTTQISFVESM